MPFPNMEIVVPGAGMVELPATYVYVLTTIQIALK